jgi:hypothetical protein
MFNPTLLSQQCLMMLGNITWYGVKTNNMLFLIILGQYIGLVWRNTNKIIDVHQWLSIWGQLWWGQLWLRFRKHTRMPLRKITYHFMCTWMKFKFFYIFFTCEIKGLDVKINLTWETFTSYAYGELEHFKCEIFVGVCAVFLRPVLTERSTKF